MELRSSGNLKNLEVSQDKTTLVTIFEVSHLNVKRCDLDVENNTKTTLN